MADTITQVINGTEYTATRIIDGKRKLRQRLVFRGHIEHDAATYRPDQRAIMDATAGLILWQLVVTGWLGQSPLEPGAPPAKDS